MQTRESLIVLVLMLLAAPVLLYPIRRALTIDNALHLGLTALAVVGVTCLLAGLWHLGCRWWAALTADRPSGS